MSKISLKNDQSGLVSIIVAIMFISIMSLIATSFALIARREQRQALDRQLSTQAFYAAESGVNDVVKNLSDLDDLNSCEDVDSVGNPDLGNGLRYTCVLVDTEPTSLDFSAIGTEESTIAKVQTADDSKIKTLQISWQASDNNDLFADFSDHKLPAVGEDQGNLDKTGIVRATIMSGQNLSRANLTDKVGDFLLYPKSHGSAGQQGSVAFPSSRAARGAFVDGRCNPGSRSTLPMACNVEITGLDTALNSSVVYVRLKGIYAQSKVTIRAKNTANAQVSFKNSQAQIDATGKANDVLRRIQVRVPLDNSYYYPEFALETGDDICKQMSLPSGLPIIYGLDCPAPPN